MPNIKIFFLFISLFLVYLFSCQKENTFTNSGHLAFSQDSVLFDTVFTTIGSSTQYLKVYNHNSQKIKISSISLGGGKTSSYFVNINGKSSSLVSNLELAANDSMFIFIGVLVDPKNSSNPFLIADSLMFSVNGKFQKVILNAWGQDAYYHSQKKSIKIDNTTKVIGSSANDDNPWLADKPHLVYGDLVIESGKTLTIPAGTKIYMHPKSRIIVCNGGSLKINGEKGKLVTIQGDRLENWYKELPNQWDQIIYLPGSTNNLINFALIKNGNYGLVVDSMPFNSTVLTINNTIIENMTSIGIYAIGTSIVGTNTVVANCGKNNLNISNGGNYSFTHCTFANYWAYTLRNNPAVYLSNTYYSSTKIVYGDLIKADFLNCIVEGNQLSEIDSTLKSSAKANYKFDYCLIKTDAIVLNSDKLSNIFTSSYITIFTNIDKNDYTLAANSPAKNKGLFSYATGIPNDLNGNSRVADGQPDLGAYEFK